MKLVYCTDSFFPELGGIQDSIAALARSLAARGHRLLIVAPEASASDYRLAGITSTGILPAGPGRPAASERPAEPDLGPRTDVVRVPAIRLPGSTGQSRLALMPGRARGAIDAFGPDLVHVHTFLLVGWYGVRTASRLGVPLIGTNHWAADGFGLYAPRFLQAATARAFMGAVARFYRRCALVTTPSRATAEAMHAAGFERPVTVASNPIDLGDFSPASGAERARLRAELGLAGRTVIYAGRLAMEKKLDVLIDAFALAARTRPDLTLALAGHGSARGALERQVRRLGLHDRVRFLGSLPHAALARWLRAGDLFGIASTSESQCMALLQAMACACPAVVVGCRALPEVLGTDAGLVARPDDPADFARCLGRLLDEPELARCCGRAASRRAALSSVSAVTDQWEALYEPFAFTGPRRDHDRHSGAQRGTLPRPVS